MQGLSFKTGDNCWRVARAKRFAVIVDGKDYFRALREALLKAQNSVILVGWDFDFEIDMLPGESNADGLAPDGFPNAVGPFLDALAERSPDLDIYILKWSGGTLFAPGQVVQISKLKILSPGQVHLALDGCHPIGACHHQKIVVIDDSLAFCGGIDVTDGRWDTHEHLPDDPRRGKGDDSTPPWHDVTTVLSGRAAADLSDLCRARWRRAHDADLDEAFTPGQDRWPESVSPDFRDIDIAIARTEPPEHDRAIIAEIEHLYLDSIAAAEDCIYLESQYFCADSIFQAIRKRLMQKGGPEVVVINPQEADNFVEDAAMHVTRSRMMRALQAVDHENRFLILNPVNLAGEPIYIHAKMEVVDDRFLRVGSSNIDRRSMGFDTECDIGLIASARADRQRVIEIRNGLLAEHLDCETEDLARMIEKTGSVIAAIKALNPTEGRGLRPIEPREEGLLGRFLADTRFFDPRYRRSAQARLGLTSRHLFWGLAALGAGAYLYRRVRRARNPQRRG